MPDPQTPNLGLYVPLNGADVGTWDVPMNANSNLLDNVIAAATSVALSNVPVTLSPTQYQTNFITFTGPLTGDVQVTFPALPRAYILYNNASGTTGFNVTCICSGAPTSITLPVGGGPVSVVTDGTTMQIVGISRVFIQVFTASGTYTPTTGMRYCIIECQAGGGGGGGVSNASFTGISGGGGGGSGAYSRKVSSAATVGASQAVTIGAAGVGLAGANGTNGGTTSVGSLCTAGGGTGGVCSGPLFGDGGGGGAAGTGDIAIAGKAGIFGVVVTSASFPGYFPSGMGGDSVYGRGAAPLVVNTPGATGGNAATGYGGGGGGAVIRDLGGSQRAGGNGTAGVVIITEFL